MAEGPKTKITTIRMKPTLMAQLTSEAAHFGVSRTELIETVLEDFLKKGRQDVPRRLWLKKELADGHSDHVDLFA